MNVGSKVGFNKSSLLSLKAELAKKHEEANLAKAFKKAKPSKPLAKPPKGASSNKIGVNIEDADKEKSPDDLPDSNTLHSSRAALEAKAKIYDELSENPASLDEDAPFLVDFSRKTNTLSKLEASKQEEDEDAKRIETDSDEYEAPSDPEDDWVEYIDCLGRTRRCLRRDLPELKAKDAELYESTKRDPPPPLPPQNDSPNVPVGLAAPDLFSDDMRREQQRQKWAEEEERIRNKPDVHYQDVLFNEARQHGVGYFAFSTDDAERRAQQTALKTLRTETEKQQAATNAARQRRADLLNKRLRAAHNRKRAREGLPPLMEDEELPQTERPDSSPPEPEPPQIQLAADPNKRGERVRPAPSVRPWDIGKEGVTTERPVMTQEEWVSKKRKERHREFAPPSFYEDRNPSGSFRSTESFRSGASSSQTDTMDDYDEPKGLYFTSKRKKTSREEPHRKPMEELEDFAEEDIVLPETKKENASSRKGVEIPPPMTMEYFGPSDKTMEARKRHSNATSRITTADLESSISAGLNFLRRQHEEKEKQRERGLLDIM